MNDSFFNIWRLSWVAHQLVHQPTALFDANIFYPARHTLAYSDAMLLVGLAGAPFLWAGVPPAVVHNGLLIAALVSSAWASAVLAHRLTGDRFAAVLAGVIVGFAPYRFAHIAHLELQWLMWMPLALLALHALVERPRPAAGLALGACLAGQLLCSIYYGVFLAVFAGVAWIALVVAHGLKPRLALSTAVAAIPLALVAAPYLAPYAASRADHGPRSATEIAHAQRPAGRLPGRAHLQRAARRRGPDRRTRRSTPARRRSASPCWRSCSRGAASGGSISPWWRSRSMRRSACTA